MKMYLEDFANSAGYVLTIRTEACCTDRALKAEVVQQHPAPLIN